MNSQEPAQISKIDLWKREQQLAHLKVASPLLIGTSEAQRYLYPTKDHIIFTVIKLHIKTKTPSRQ